jgi:hypothetical protein
MFCKAQTALLWLALLLLVLDAQTTIINAVTMTKDLLLQTVVADLRGNDTRLVRWDATKHTAERQRQGSCQDLPDVLETILVHADQHSPEAVLLAACEYVTLCITDNPKHRAIFASISGIHEAITKLVLHNSMYLSSKACHVIYIASFANPVNHQRFANIGAIEALSKIIKQENLAEDQSPRLAAQVMWASAALANLAASYCETDEGRCFWE